MALAKKKISAFLPAEEVNYKKSVILFNLIN